MCSECKNKKGMPYVVWTKAQLSATKRQRMRWLADAKLPNGTTGGGDWDYRDPSDDLHAVDTGANMAAVSSLPALTRMLYESADMHVELQETEENSGRYKLVSVVKKREAEFLQGSYQCFVIDHDGTHVPVDETQLDELLGLKASEEDVYSRDDVERVSVELSYSCPHDTWDVVFDCSSLLSTLRALAEDDVWLARSTAQKKQDLHHLIYGTPVLDKNGQVKRDKRTNRPIIDTTLVVDDGKRAKEYTGEVYSADFFPYSRDNRLKTNLAKRIAKRIRSESLSKREVAQLINQNDVQDKRPKLSKETHKQAMQLPPGRKRLALLAKAHKIMMDYRHYRELLDEQRKEFTETQRSMKLVLSPSERRALWQLWQDTQLRLGHTVELPAWKYQWMVFHKLVRQGHDELAAARTTHLLAKKHYGDEVKLIPLKLPEYLKQPHVDWHTKLNALQNNSSSTTDDGFIHSDWLEKQKSFVLQSIETDEGDLNV